MRESFKIGSLNNKQQYVVVYSTNFSRLEEYIDELAFDLKNQCFAGKVIIDLLLNNGISSNRYIEVPFDGNFFHLKALKVLSKVNDDIKTSSRIFYSSNPDILNNSILNKAQKFLLKKGIY